MPNHDREQLTRFLRLAVAQGFDSYDDIVRNGCEVYCDGRDPQDAEGEVAAALDIMLVEHDRAMRDWPQATDCDRLDAAFEELNARGIMARHNWTCCGNCCRAEMPDEFARLGGQWEGHPIIGYTFYHQQGTESAADGAGLYLSYGSTERADSESAYESQSLRIAHTVCDALRTHGLRVNWDGTYARTIGVALDWKRRVRPSRFCGGDDFEPRC